MINILDLQPHVVSSDLAGYVIGMYGAPGCGKTSTAAEFPNSIVLACEKGYLAIPGIIAQDITSWTEILTAVNQLKSAQAREKFKVVIIDTIDSLTFFAIQDIKSRTGVKDLADIPYGKGYTLLEEMFRSLFKEITDRYGLVIIAHPNKKQDDTDEKVKYWDLAINKKVKGIVMGLLDILMFIETNRYPDKPNIAHFRSSEFFEAKSRFKRIVPSIELSYENLCKAVADAAGVGATQQITRAADTVAKSYTAEEVEKLREAANAIGAQKVEKIGPERVLEKIALILGKKIATASIGDGEKLELLIEELKLL